MANAARHLKNAPQTRKKDRGKAAWAILAILLICLPVAAVAKLILATDDELDDISAQSLMTFKTVKRYIDGNGFNTFSYTATILKLNAEMTVVNVAINSTRMGYWAGVEDIRVDNGNRGLIIGTSAYPVVFRGVRIELGWGDAIQNDATYSDDDFLFFRMGTDNFSGQLNIDPDNNGTGSIDRVSMSGRVYGESSLGDVPLYINRARHNTFSWDSGFPLGYIQISSNDMRQLYYNCGPGAGTKTDWYISLADLMRDRDGTSNNIARGDLGANYPAAAMLPGRGYWMHFQSLYGQVTVW